MPGSAGSPHNRGVGCLRRTYRRIRRNKISRTRPLCGRDSNTVREYEQSKEQAIAVVFHIGSDGETEGNGYAVYLWDMTPKAFADSLGVEQGTSADITAYDGNENTFALYETEETASPMAEAVFALWKYGQSAYVPSVAQMRLLYAARGIINPVIEKCGGDPLPTEADECWYWTSTEVEGQQTVKAWLYSTASGAMQETPKTQAHKVRPIITINN